MRQTPFSPSPLKIGRDLTVPGFVSPADLCRCPLPECSGVPITNEAER